MGEDKTKISTAKKVCLGITFALAVIFAAACFLAAKKYIRMKNNCTEEIYGRVTNSQVETTHRKGKSHTKASADIVVDGDGTFPTQTIHTTSVYFAKQESVLIYYDPNDPDEYYFYGGLREQMTLVILFGVISAGELALGAGLTRYTIRKSRKKDGYEL